MSDLIQEIKRRRTFAIISHPDAGKTTVTEKMLLYANAIQMAGTVKAKKAKHFATSDWMEIEKQRGISVSSSVMQFTYGGCEINLLDTPGHADFSEDTYRVLTAVDSALMVIDSTKGIQAQTRKLFEVCRTRNIPIITLFNKMDLEGRDPFDLIAQVENELQLECTVMNWPLGQGRRFKGVYDFNGECLRLIEPNKATVETHTDIFTDLNDPKLKEKVEDTLLDRLSEDLELVRGAGHAFNRESFLEGHLSPAFFASAHNNMGMKELLDSFVNLAPSPRSRVADTRTVEATEKKFTGLIFKVQANMDPKHRDRVAFMRICSGRFEQGMTVRHTRAGKDVRINNALQFMSQKRTNVDEAFAGDILGIHDKGTYMIGDTLTDGENLKFLGIPQFSPELFNLVQLKSPLKSKQLQKGLDELSEEGTSQVFRRDYSSDVILGVVGNLQFEVVKFRLQNEYGADVVYNPLPFTCSRWILGPTPKALETFVNYYKEQVVYDVRDYPMILFKNDWEQNYIQGKYPEIKFYSSLINYEADAQS